MKDKEFLKWLDRTLKEFANRTPCGEPSIEDKIAKFKRTYSGEGSGMDLLNIIEALNKRMDKIEARS